MNIRPFSAILLSRRREIGKGSEVEAYGVAKRFPIQVSDSQVSNSQISNSQQITFSRR
ncbi:hypothetical protein V1282_000583 [Nitrobacteraceae bacterium AZCC 2146]